MYGSSLEFKSPTDQFSLNNYEAQKCPEIMLLFKKSLRTVEGIEASFITLMLGWGVLCMVTIHIIIT